MFDYDAIARLIMGLVKLTEVQLVFDRTHWQFGKKHINILMLAIIYKSVAIPIFWTGLSNGKGNSSTQDRIDLIKKFRQVFPEIKMTNVVADAEFIGQDWFNWLNTEKIPFCIPIRSNAQVKRYGRNETVNISRCFEIIKKAGEIKHLKRRKVIYGNRIYLSAVRLKDKSLLIVASNTFQGDDLLDKYRQRWQIEMLFSCLKMRGFDFEATHLTDPVKIEKLLAIVAVTFVWAYVVGQWQHEQKPIKVKSHQRLAKSVFRIGMEIIAKAAMKILATLDYFLTLRQVIRFLSCTERPSECFKSFQTAFIIASCYLFN